MYTFFNLVNQKLYNPYLSSGYLSRMIHVFQWILDFVDRLSQALKCKNTRSYRALQSTCCTATSGSVIPPSASLPKGVSAWRFLFFQHQQLVVFRHSDLCWRRWVCYYVYVWMNTRTCWVLSALWSHYWMVELVCRLTCDELRHIWQTARCVESSSGCTLIKHTLHLYCIYNHTIFIIHTV